MYLEDKARGYALPEVEPHKTHKQTREPWRLTLREAAKRIEIYGWCQNTLVNDDGHHCVIGALFNVHQSLATFNRAVRKLEQHITSHRYAEDSYRPGREQRKLVADWNDAPGRTQEEVVATLRKVAAEG